MQRKGLKNNRRKKGNARTTQENQSDTESLYFQIREGMHIQDTNEETEVTEDFLAFLEQSKKHREEWRITKSQNKGISQEEALNTKEVMAPYTLIKVRS